MKCRFPMLAAGSSYNKGCRCDRCRTHKREVNKASAGRSWEKRCSGIQKRYPVPAEPILRLLESWLTEVGSQTDIPIEVLAQELRMKESTAARMVYRLRNRETTYMSFNAADNIVSKLYGPHFWLLDDELHAIYEEHA